jgi:hypothetical protein
MSNTLPDTFPIPVYDQEEITEMGYTMADALPKILKGTRYWVLKKDVAAELEWSKKKFGSTK